MRVLAVAHVLNLGNLNVDRPAPRHRFLVLVERGKIVRDDAIVVGCMLEGFAKDTEMSFRPYLPSVLSEFGKNRTIVLWINDYSDMLIVLRRCPHHTWAADIDVFDDLIEGCAACHRRFEG